MGKAIQIRNVPEALHRELKTRAASAGMSLSEYLLSEIREIIARPTLPEFQQTLSSRQPVKLSISPAARVRAERDNR